MGLQDWTAAGMYGIADTSPQPTPTPQPTHEPGTPEPMMRTTRLPGMGGMGLAADNPIVVLVALVGLAILLTQVTLRGSLEVEA